MINNTFFIFRPLCTGSRKLHIDERTPSPKAMNYYILTLERFVLEVKHINTYSIYYIVNIVRLVDNVKNYRGVYSWLNKND